jgi:hypothetical protein
VYNVLETVDRGDLAFAALVGPSYDQNFVVFSDWDGADLEIVRETAAPPIEITDVVFVSEFLAQWGTHDRTSNAGRGIVMGLARLSP